MKRISSLATLLALPLCLAPAAAAANFDGYYVGATAGYASGQGKVDVHNARTSDGVTDTTPRHILIKPEGAALGLVGGVNHREGNLVFGVEANLTVTKADGDSRVPTLRANGTEWVGVRHLTSMEIQAMASIRGRLGVVVADRFLAYATLGGAAVKFKGEATIDYSEPGDVWYYPTSTSTIKPGAVYGAGLEFALNSKLTLKAEYLHYQMKKVSKDSGPYDETGPVNNGWRYYSTFDPSVATYQVGVNYRF